MPDQEEEESKFEEFLEKVEKSIAEDYADSLPVREDEEDDEEDPEYVQWIRIGKNNYFPEGKITKVKKLKAGVYDIAYSRQRQVYYAIYKKLALDELFVFPDPIQDRILKDIQIFWERREEFKKYGYAYKRGLLLWGEPGSGKTSIINLLAKELMEKYKGVIFFLNTPSDLEPFIGFVKNYFRQVQPTTKIICVIEDIEAFCDNSHTEGLLLNVLDGLNNMEDVVFLASTNYPEKLKERILNRPSRFDRRYEIKSPSAIAREAYFQHKLKPEDLREIDLAYWVKKTNKFTVAHLGEIVKSVFALGNSFEDTVKELRDMAKKISSFNYNKDEDQDGIGFKRSGLHQTTANKTTAPGFPTEEDEAPDPGKRKSRY
jgi:hypothetical protein